VTVKFQGIDVLELVEIELKRVRKIAAQADDTVLNYMIDMAIMAAKAKAGSSGAAGKDSPVGQNDRDVKGPDVG
jgi:hypothetical protein